MLLGQFSYCAFMKTKDLDAECGPKVTVFMGLVIASPCHGCHLTVTSK